MLIATELEPPRELVWLRRGRKIRLPGLEPFQILALEFLALWVQPDFHPGIARDFDSALGLDRPVIGIESFEVHLHLVLGPEQMVCRFGIHKIALSSHAHAAAAADLAPAGVGHARLDPVFEIRARPARSVEGQRRLAGGVGADGFALYDLARAAEAALPPAFHRVHVLIKPWVIAQRMPGMIERILIDEDLHAGIDDRAAEVILGLDSYLNFFAKPKGLLRAVLLGGRDGYFEFGQFVFLEPEQCGGADFVFSALVP